MASYLAFDHEDTRFINVSADKDKCPDDEIGSSFGAARDASSIGHFGIPRVREPQPSDDKLIEAARFGSQVAFVELCRRYSKSIERTIFRIVRNRQDTEDLLQEAILSAYQHLNGFRGNCSFGTWVTKIGINKSLMLLRKRQTHPEVLFQLISSESKTIDIPEFPDHSPSPEQIYATKQINEVVRQAVGRLPTGLRDIFEHHYGDECSLAESASTFSLTVPAVKSRLLRARRKLRESLSRAQDIL